MEQESNSKLELYKKMAKQEAEALAQKLPELDEVESSDSDDEDGEVGNAPESGDLKRLFKQIVKNANSKDKVDMKKEYGGLMSKYMNRRAHQSNLAAVGGGILNEHISDGLNLQKQKTSEDGTNQRVGVDEMMEGTDGQRLKSKRAHYPV